MDHPVVVDPAGVLTYAELDVRADELAAGLAARGVGRGDVVAVTLPSGGDWLVVAVAVDRVRAVLAGVSTAITTAERRDLVELVRPTLVAGRDRDRRRHAVALPTSWSWAPAAGDGSSRCRAGRPPRSEGDDDERPAAICFTSGTTGRAKAALFRVRHLRAVQRIDLGPDAEQIWGGGAAMLASTQFAHVGMTTKFPWYLRVGATLHVMSRWRPDDALELVARHRMPTIGVVAPQLALMLRSPLMEELDLTCVQGIIAGGAASPPSLVAEARERFGADYSIRYSSTESGGVGLGTAFGAPDSEALYTVGRPRPGVEVRIGTTRPPHHHQRGRGAAAEVGRGHGRLLGDPRALRPRSPPTAGCGPAIWPASTTTVASCCRAGGPRCTSEAATTCSRARSKRS